MEIPRNVLIPTYQLRNCETVSSEAHINVYRITELLPDIGTIVYRYRYSFIRFKCSYCICTNLLPFSLAPTCKFILSFALASIYVDYVPIQVPLSYLHPS